MKDKHVLITGGAGFIGSNLAIRLASMGAEVTAFDSFYPGGGGNEFNLEPVRGKIRFENADQNDERAMDRLVEGQEVVFNLAAQCGHQESMSRPLADLEMNVRSHLTLLEACRRQKRAPTVVYGSTRQIYGVPKYLPVDENHPIAPVDVNGVHKLAGEQHHALYSRVYGIPTISLRLTNTYGPRQPIRDAKLGFTGWFVNRVLANETIQLFGGGDQVRDFNAVDDVVDALLLGSEAAQSPEGNGRAFNLAGEKASLASLAERLVRIAGQGKIQKVEFPPDRKKIDIGNYYGSCEPFTALTGWRPKTSLDTGLGQMVDYFQRHQEHYLS